MIELHDHVKRAFFRLYLKEKARGKHSELNIADAQKPLINHIYMCIYIRETD